MRKTSLRWVWVLCVGALVCMLSACARSAPAARGSTVATGNTVYDAWTTPPSPGTVYPARSASPSALQPAPRAVATAPAPRTPIGPRSDWSVPVRTYTCGLP